VTLPRARASLPQRRLAARSNWRTLVSERPGDACFERVRERIVTCSKVPVIFRGRDDAAQALGFDALGFAIERERLFA